MISLEFATANNINQESGTSTGKLPKPISRPHRTTVEHKQSHSMTCTALCGHSAVCHTTHTHVSHFRGRELVLRPLPRPSRVLRRKPSRRCAQASAFAGALAAPSSDPVGSIRGLINMASAAALIVAAWWYLSSAQVCACLAHHLAACAACVHHSSAYRLTSKRSSNFESGACLPHVSPHSVVVTNTSSARSKCCSHTAAPQPFLLAYLL